MAGFLGSGDLYYNRVVGGVDQGWLRFGNATKFSIKENADLKERKSKQKATYGQVLNSVSVKQPAELSISLDDLDKDVLAMAFLGSTSAINVTAGSVTAEDKKTGSFGGFVRTNFGYITNPIVIKDKATGLVTYVAGTDYEVASADRGMIKILSGGTITENELITIDYAYNAVTGNKVSGGTTSSIKVAVMLDGENFADQSKVEVNCWEAVLAPTGEVDFLSDDFATLELAGTLNTPVGKTSPYEVSTDLVSA